MKQAIRAAVMLVGLFNLVLGFAFLIRPAEMAAKFFIVPQGIQGLATIRADFAALFVTGGLFALYGAWNRRAAPLAVPIILLAIALTGRCITLIVDGVVPTSFTPMMVEAVMIAVLILGTRAFATRQWGR
ncbi:DUF4345 family protein [Sphingomonas alpina]|uniref:DUF4345 family protein n=1 Tax=Sphingomonas alpina TaxID=653931 RepID=A0A7H0LGR5_9SPHN|nr:DUF4345 family protein [Sphingomonas alpina]QNQ08868.1 DUF4345 family protein [Sphingomonas alpina]